MMRALLTRMSKPSNPNTTSDQSNPIKANVTPVKILEINNIIISDATINSISTQ